jgi:hypothetical protein
MKISKWRVGKGGLKQQEQGKTGNGCKLSTSFILDTKKDHFCTTIGAEFERVQDAGTGQFMGSLACGGTKPMLTHCCGKCDEMLAMQHSKWLRSNNEWKIVCSICMLFLAQEYP